jgi:hypothetical protein
MDDSFDQIKKHAVDLVTVHTAKFLMGVAVIVLVILLIYYNKDSVAAMCGSIDDKISKLINIIHSKQKLPVEK